MRVLDRAPGIKRRLKRTLAHAGMAVTARHVHPQDADEALSEQSRKVLRDLLRAREDGPRMGSRR